MNYFSCCLLHSWHVISNIFLFFANSEMYFVSCFQNLFVFCQFWNVFCFQGFCTNFFFSILSIIWNRVDFSFWCVKISPWTKIEIVWRPEADKNCFVLRETYSEESSLVQIPSWFEMLVPLSTIHSSLSVGCDIRKISVKVFSTFKRGF